MAKQRFISVKSPAEGLAAIQAADVTDNYRKALRWRPRHKRAVLVPCAGTKPFPEAPSHEHGYLPALEGKDVDIWVVSEPLGIVPYSWSERWPQNSYDFPPKHLKGRAHDVLSGRVASWIKRVAPKYDKITLALPLHHRRLWDKGLEMAGGTATPLRYVGISDCREDGACPETHFRATSPAYKKYLRARANPRGSGMWFWTDCVGMPDAPGAGAGEFVRAIIDHPADRRISFRQFTRLVDLDSFPGDHPARYRWSAPDNWAISFHRSALPSGAPVAYFKWSGIEHFFVDDDFNLQLEQDSLRDASA
jgi:hypothetical protein